MNLLIKQDRPADQKYNKLYYVMDEQWTKLTALDMRTVLVNEKLEDQSSCSTPASPSPMPHSKSSTSSTPMRSPIYMELASFKKGIKSEAFAYSILKDERFFDTGKEYSAYMTTESKGASEKRKLTQYVTNTVLDSQCRGISHQFVLHFNEQFMRLDELTDLTEKMPESIKMALIQNAVKNIPQLSIVESLDEYTSTTTRN